jgi:hypothetical protein
LAVYCCNCLKHRLAALHRQTHGDLHLSRERLETDSAEDAQVACGGTRGATAAREYEQAHDQCRASGDCYVARRHRKTSATEAFPSTCVAEMRSAPASK